MKSAEIYGPWRFRLKRLEDETGISGTGYVADGARFYNGQCVLVWSTRHSSVAVYPDLDTLKAIHEHGGKTVVEWLDEPPTPAFEHGLQNAIQDQCGNCPFSSVGGLSARPNLKAPRYVAPEDAAEYLRGYRAHALAAFGDDWATCEFGWQPAIELRSFIRAGVG